MSEIRPTGNMPLRDKRVLVAASPQTSERLRANLEAWGARMVHFPTIEIRRLHDPAALAQVLPLLGEYRWIIFTSSHGVRSFMEHLADRGLSKEHFGQSKICAVGPATARAAEMQGLKVDLVPEEYVAEGVLKALAKQAGGLHSLAGCRILLPRAKEARDIIPRELAASGALVDILPCYETLQAKENADAVRDLLEKTPDLLIFTSSSNVSSFVAILGHERGTRILNQGVIAALGPVTAQTISGFGKQPEILPQENTVESLLRAIFTYFDKR